MIRYIIGLITIGCVSVNGQTQTKSISFKSESDVVIERDIHVKSISGGGSFYNYSIYDTEDPFLKSDQFKIIIGGKASSTSTSNTDYPWVCIIKENELLRLYDKDQSIESSANAHGKKLNPTIAQNVLTISQRANKPNPYLEHFEISSIFANKSFGRFERVEADEFMTIGEVMTCFKKNLLRDENWPKINHLGSQYNLQSVTGGGIVCFLKDNNTTIAFNAVSDNGKILKKARDYKNYPDNQLIGVPFTDTENNSYVWQVDRRKKDSAAFIINKLSNETLSSKGSYTLGREGTKSSFSQSKFFEEFILEQNPVQAIMAPKRTNLENPQVTGIFVRYNNDSSEFHVGGLSFQFNKILGWEEMWKESKRPKDAGKVNLLMQNPSNVTASYYQGSYLNPNKELTHKITIGFIDREKVKQKLSMDVLFSETELRKASKSSNAKFEYLDHVVVMNGNSTTYVVGIFKARTSEETKTILAFSKFKI